MNLFQRQRMKTLKRVAFDAGQWISGTEDSLNGQDRISHSTRNRWAFDPLTAVVLSVAIVIVMAVLMYGAQALPQDTVSDAAQSYEQAESSEPAWWKKKHKHSDESDSGRHDADHNNSGNNQHNSVGDKGAKLRQAHTLTSSNIPSSEADGTMIVVHVAGAVHAPGIVTLPAGTRAHQAIAAAGGAQDNAAMNAINLAAQVHDGDYLYLPTNEEQHAGTSPGLATSSTAQPNSQTHQCVDVNTANAEELQQLPGVGPALSQRIIDHRNTHGRFTTLEDLDEVSGIGVAMLNKLRDRVCP